MACPVVTTIPPDTSGFDDTPFSVDGAQKIEAPFFEIVNSVRLYPPKITVNGMDVKTYRKMSGQNRKNK